MAFGRRQEQSASSAGDMALEFIKAATDPNSAKRVKELLDATKAHEAKVKEAKDHHAEADRKLEQAHQTLEEAKGKEANAVAERARLQRLDTELSERKRTLDIRENDLAQKERAAAEYHSQLYASIEQHNAAKAAWAKESATLKEKLAADRDALEKRLKEARAFLRV